VSDDDLPDDELVKIVVPVFNWRAQHAYPMALVMPGLRNWVDQFSSAGIRPAQRLKRFRSIMDKLNRHPGMKLARMQDIGGCRAVLANASEVDRVASKVRRYWNPIREKDYRDTPNPITGYRALHQIVEKRDKVTRQRRAVEIQLRTVSEHTWAEEVWRTGNRLGYALKDGQGPAELLEYFRMASDLLWRQDRGHPIDGDFVTRFQSIREKVEPYFARS
jgi:putative GTP pyrophosphokinase